MTGIVIAIDGPSGVGKSTVSRAVAEKLGMAYLDTGATYRACALACMREGVKFADKDYVTALAETMNVRISMDPRDPRVLLDEDDITSLIRGDAVTMAVSDVATNLDARAVLGRWQRRLIDAERTAGFSGGGGVVAEGRDITTVIAPDADVRVLMTADPEVRVARRKDDGTSDNDEATRAGVIERDAKDATVVNFQRAADGVVTLDTTDLTIDEAVAAVMSLAHEAAL